MYLVSGNLPWGCFNYHHLLTFSFSEKPHYFSNVKVWLFFSKADILFVLCTRHDICQNVYTGRLWTYYSATCDKYHDCCAPVCVCVLPRKTGCDNCWPFPPPLPLWTLNDHTGELFYFRTVHLMLNSELTKTEWIKLEIGL